MNSNTFNRLHFLKKKYGERYTDYDYVVGSEVECFSTSAIDLSFTEWLSKLDGIFPVDLFSFLKR